MKLCCLFWMLMLVTTNLCGQENYVLETRYRNPIDTASFMETPTMLLFVHSKCKHGHLCPTTLMQKALENDSLGFRSKYGIALFVIYPSFSQENIESFDSFSPGEKATIAFYTNSSYKGMFGESATTPYVVFYDGQGHIHSKTGGTIEELCDSVNTTWRYSLEKCLLCKGTGSVKPNLKCNDPDWVVGICPRCRGRKHNYKSNYQ